MRLLAISTNQVSVARNGIHQFIFELTFSYDIADSYLDRTAASSFGATGLHFGENLQSMQFWLFRGMSVAMQGTEGTIKFMNYMLRVRYCQFRLMEAL